MKRRYSGKHRPGVPLVPCEPRVHIRVHAETHEFARSVQQALLRLERATGRPLGLK